MATAYQYTEGVNAGRLHRQKYRCPDCSGLFTHTYRSDDPAFPERCPLCNSWVSEDEPPAEVFEAPAPMIKKNTFGKSEEQTYRAVSEASVARANDAADQLADRYAREDRENPFEGNEAILKDFQKNQIDELRSGLKITNMKTASEMREGDSAVVGSASAAAQNLTVGASKPGFQNFGAGNAPPVTPGNANFVSQFTSNHTARATEMIAAGRMNKD